MSALSLAADDVDPADRAFILAEWIDGQNTFDIGRAVGLPEAVVAEIVRAERERRVEAYAGRRER